MIRILLQPKISYDAFRIEYVKWLVACHALRLDDRKVLRAIDPECTLSQLRRNYVYSFSYGKKNVERNHLDCIPGLRDILFCEDGEINQDGLLRLLAGPEQPPDCITDESHRQGLLRSHFQSLYQEIEKGLTGQTRPDAMDCCKNIFVYDNMKEAAYWLMDQLQVRTCPYCNRVYTTQSFATKLRPPFDHFIPKSKHPYFGLSLFNLVPACDYCNRKKGEGDPNILVSPDLSDLSEKWLIYPYDEGYDDENEKAPFEMRSYPGEGFQFLKALRGENTRFQLNIQTSGSPKGKQIQNAVTKLGIKDIYGTHKQEVQKIAQLHYWYSHTYLKQLLSLVVKNWKDLPPPSQVLLIGQVKEKLYFADLAQEDWGNAPLNKLKADILAQLDKYEQTSEIGTDTDNGKDELKNEQGSNLRPD